MGLDPMKDQSYVLSVLTQEKLRHAMFPIGGYEKPAVRAMAAELGLPVAQKSDSQDLCFLGDGDYRRFLRDHNGSIFAAGEIRTRAGEVLGEHNGLPNYTIGQRKGLGITAPQPMYVLEMDVANNTLIVGTAADLGSDALTAERVNWIADAPPDKQFRASVKIRYKSRPHPATVTVLDEGRIQVQFDEPRRDITPGQGAVVYQDDLCLGGGVIVRGGEKS
jgi:tRNA-specific 2-thiouridylase